MVIRNRFVDADYTQFVLAVVFIFILAFGLLLTLSWHFKDERKNRNKTMKSKRVGWSNQPNQVEYYEV